MMSTHFERRFGGIGRLYGPAALARFGQAHVCVVGVGGVGSWAVEALARSGIGRLTLIDLDNIAESNVNRQIHALDGEYGKAKVSAMAERVRRINPGCGVQEVEDFLTEDNAAAWLSKDFDFVLDAIDNVRVKTAMVAHCRQQAVPLVVTGAAGGKLDPTRIVLGDLAATTQDPLLSKVRARLRRDHGFTREPNKKFKVPAVYSTEPIAYPTREAAACDVPATPATPGAHGLNCAGYGSSMVVTATVGLVAVSVVLGRLAGQRA